MQFLKNVRTQPTHNNMPLNNDNEIKTFSNLRNRSPMATNSYYARRSPVKRDQRTLDSGAGEMMYVEPNEVNFRPNNDEPSQISNNYLMRSPGDIKDDRIRNEYERSQIETSQHMGYANTNTNANRIPQFNIDIDKRRERLSRSPKTINIGESAQEAEYNIKTLRGRSPHISRSNSPFDNPVVERSYNVMSETGNIFLDQPMQQGSFVRQNEIIGSPGYMQQNSYEMKGSQEIGNNNSREIRFTMNPRDLQEPMPGILQKMSPHVNIDGESDSGSEKNDNVQIKDLRTQLDNKKSNVIVRNDDGMNEGRRIPNEMDKLEDMVRPRETQENITGEEMKR